MRGWFKGFNPSNYYRQKHEKICLKCPYASNCTKDTGGTYSCRVSRAYDELKSIK